MNSSRRSSWSLKRLATCSHIDYLCRRGTFRILFRLSRHALRLNRHLMTVRYVLRPVVLCVHAKLARCRHDLVATGVLDTLGGPEAARLVVHLLDALLRLAVLVEDLEEALVDVLTRAEALLYFVDVVYRLRAPLLL